MKTKIRYRPLPVPIPLDYYEALGLAHPGQISHVNHGRKRFRDDQVMILMEAAETDPRLKGLNILDLRQEIAPFLSYVCKLCPREAKKAAKKKGRQADHAKQ